MDERTKKVAGLLHECGETHHVVYRITDGARLVERFGS
jgi:hypothetical protein